MFETSLARSKIRNPFGGLSAGRISCGYSNRWFGNMSLCYGSTAGALDNRKGFLGGLGLDYRQLVCGQQVHASAVRYATEPDRGRGSLGYDSAFPGTDGFVTDKKDVPLAIFTADCLSVFLYDPNTPAVGLLHAGWRSTRDNICGEGIKKMQDLFGTDPKAVYAAFGPAIRDCCYEVSQEFGDYFPHAVFPRGRSLYLNLAFVNRSQLIASGVKDANIFDSGGCTYCGGDNFFSYRKEGASCGRMMSVIMLL